LRSACTDRPRDGCRARISSWRRWIPRSIAVGRSSTAGRPNPRRRRGCPRFRSRRSLGASSAGPFDVGRIGNDHPIVEYDGEWRSRLLSAGPSWEASRKQRPRRDSRRSAWEAGEDLSLPWRQGRPTPLTRGQISSPAGRGRDRLTTLGSRGGKRVETWKERVL